MSAVIIIIIVVAASAWYFARSMKRAGYPELGSNTIVRCHSGHLFTTVWVPFMSFKAIRLGLVRFQYCPVGRHWALVVPQKRSSLTDAERRSAAESRDKRVP